MQAFVPFASPWWVNLSLLVPAGVYLLSIKQRFRIGPRLLAHTALFGVAFGFVEAAVVVYLRAASGLWPEPPAGAVFSLPASLFRIEYLREAATLVMLGTIALLAAKTLRERTAIFLWTFAFWDVFYYLWLRLTIGWPAYLLSPDVLFLIPTPWIAQVWFPLLVSGLTAFVIGLRCSTHRS